MTQDLLNGFQEFRKTAYDGDNNVMDDLVKNGQDPKYFIISCIDSRANPGTIFSPAPGTFFAHKAMGAIVDSYEKGSVLAAELQFALNYQNVDTVIVMGHTKCGAVKALVDDMDDYEIKGFVGQMKSCVGNDYRDTEQNVVMQSIENLKTYPSVQKALSEDRLNIKGWIFDLEEGAILEADNGAFKAAA